MAWTIYAATAAVAAHTVVSETSTYSSSLNRADTNDSLDMRPRTRSSSASGWNRTEKFPGHEAVYRQGAGSVTEAGTDFAIFLDGSSSATAGYTIIAGNSALSSRNDDPSGGSTYNTYFAFTQGATTRTDGEYGNSSHSVSNSSVSSESPGMTYTAYLLVSRSTADFGTTTPVARIAIGSYATWFRRLVDKDGTTIQRGETSSTGETNGTVGAGNATINDPADAVTPNTATLWLADGFFTLPGFASATSSAAITSAWAGGTSGGTRSSVVDTQLTTTLSGAYGTITAPYTTTTVQTAAIGSTTFVASTNTTRNVTKISWNGATTAAVETTEPVATTSTRAASAGENRTAGRTFVLYSPPWVTSDRAFSQAASVYADTDNGEFFWRCSTPSAFFEGGTTATSSAFAGFDTYAVGSTAFQSMLNDTDTWPVVNLTTVNVAGVDPLVGVTTATQAASVLGPLPVTVLANATAGSTATVVQPFARTLTTTLATIDSVGTIAGDFPAYQGAAGTITSTAQQITTVAGGLTVGWDAAGSSFGLIPYALRGTTSVAITTFTTNAIIAGFSGTGSPAAAHTTAYAHAAGRTTAANVERVNGFELMGRASSAHQRWLRPAGPRGQVPAGVMGWAQNDALGFGGAEAFFARAWVDGTSLAVPVASPLTTTRVSGASSSTYYYDVASSRVVGTSATASTHSSTFSSSFSAASVARVFGFVDEGASSMTALSTTGVPILRFGNNEAWAGNRGALGIGAGAVRITTESDNTTANFHTYYDTRREEAMGDTQAAIEQGWAACESSSTYTVGASPRIAVLKTSHVKFTA